MMEIGNKNNNNIIYGDGKWLVFIQRNKYKIEDFIYSLEHIKGLFTLKITSFKKKKKALILIQSAFAYIIMEMEVMKIF